MSHGTDPALQACPRCGYGDLRMPSAADGVIVGLGQNLSLMACRRCGLVATPLMFDSYDALVAFRKERSGDDGWTRTD